MANSSLNYQLEAADEEDDGSTGGNAFAAQLRRRALKREQNAALFEPKQNEAEIQWKKVCSVRKCFLSSSHKVEPKILLFC